MEQLVGPRTVGHVLGIALGAASIAAVFVVPSGSNSEGDAVGPPLPVVIFSVVAGLAIIALLAWSWRTRRRGPCRVAAILLVLGALGALPAFSQSSVSAGVKTIAGVSILLALVDVVLLFYPDRRTTTA